MVRLASRSCHKLQILADAIIVRPGLNYVSVWNAAMVQTKDVKDAMLAGIQKKKPTFSKL